MKTEKILAKTISIIWLTLMMGVVLMYSTSCSSKSGQKHRQQQILKEQQVLKDNLKYVGSEDYYELLEAIAIIDDMNDKESDDFYSEMLAGVADELDYILYEKISE